MNELPLTFSAEFLDLSRASIVNIEKGRQRPPIHLLWSIAKVLNIDLSILLPQFKASDTSIDEWKQIILKEARVNKSTQVKLLGFIEEVQELNIRKNVK